MSLNCILVIKNKNQGVVKSHIQGQFWNLEIKGFHLAPGFMGLQALWWEIWAPNDLAQFIPSLPSLPSCTKFVFPECWHLDNDATSKIDDVFTKNGGLLHVLHLAVHLNTFLVDN